MSLRIYNRYGQEKVGENAPVPALVAALPATPFDGQEIYYLADATNGVVWHLRYRASSASAYKWEYLGGSHLVSNQVSTACAMTATGAYTDFSDGLPTLALPLTGDYIIDFGAEMSHTGTNQGMTIQPVATGLTGGANGGAYVEQAVQPGTANSALYALTGKIRVTGISGTLKLQYLQGAAGGSAQRRRLAATPVRVG
jgi:hypothetical protein